VYSRPGVLTVRQCIMDIYRELGLRGFYKGITASYYGISETAIHFVIYEHLKQRMLAAHGPYVDGDRTAVNFVEFMGAAAVSKTTATCITYPHGE
jgi:solute carrier family 25, member 33/36